MISVCLSLFVCSAVLFWTIRGDVSRMCSESTVLVLKFKAQGMVKMQKAPTSMHPCHELSFEERLGMQTTNEDMQCFG